MYRQYRESIPIGYAGCAIDRGYSPSKAHPSREAGVSCSAPDTKFLPPEAAICEDQVKDKLSFCDEESECECRESDFERCEKKEINPCEKSKSEDLLSKLFGEKFSLEDFIFIGILVLLAFGKADDEIMLIIGLLLLISF